MAIDVKKQIRDNLSRLIRQPSGDTLRQNDDGSFTATVEYICSWDKLLELMPRRYQGKHPDFNGLLVDNVSASREKPGIARLKVTYAGSGESDGGPDATGEFLPIEELDRSTRQEPIESHPDWASIAGTAASPLNDAVFDPKTEIFTGFASGSSYEGVTSYLAPGATYNRSYMTDTKPASIAVGTIVSPTGAPSVSGSYNWLSAGQQWRRQGGLYSVSESYILSGPAGWNSGIY